MHAEKDTSVYLPICSSKYLCFHLRPFALLLKFFILDCGLKSRAIMFQHGSGLRGLGMELVFAV